MYNKQSCSDKKLILIKYKGEHCEMCDLLFNIDNIKDAAFHHIDPNEKDFCISRLFTGHYSLIRIKKELQKCICLCSNCHRKEHNE